MSGTTPMAPYTKLDSTSMLGTTYKTTIDGNSVAALRIVGKFLPHAQTSPNMTVVIDAGHIFDGATLTEVAAQTTPAFAAPIGHPRIDRIVVDNTTGTISVVAGTEATSPVPPAIPAGKSPVAQIAFITGTTAITNTQITDERDFSAANAGGFGQQDTISSSATCDIGTVTSHNLTITGTATISSFGSSASALQPIYFIEFSGALTLTYDATSMILPGAQNINTTAGDTAIAEYLGSGNWRIRDYALATGKALYGAVTAASASDQQAGTSVTLFTSPATQQDHPSALKAWVHFSNNGTIISSYNVSSVSNPSSGQWVINFSSPLNSADYCVLTGSRGPNASTVFDNVVVGVPGNAAPSTTSCPVTATTSNTGNQTATPQQIYVGFAGN